MAKSLLSQIIKGPTKKEKEKDRVKVRDSKAAFIDQSNDENIDLRIFEKNVGNIDAFNIF